MPGLNRPDREEPTVSMTIPNEWEETRAKLEDRHRYELMNVLLLSTRQLFDARDQQLRQRDDFLKAQSEDRLNRIASVLMLFSGGVAAVYSLAPDDDRVFGSTVAAIIILICYIIAILCGYSRSQLDARALSAVRKDVDQTTHQLLRDLRRTEVTAHTMNYYNASVLAGYESITKFWGEKAGEAYAQLKLEKDEPQWSGDHAIEWEDLIERCRAIQRA